MFGSSVFKNGLGLLRKDNTNSLTFRDKEALENEVSLYKQGLDPNLQSLVKKLIKDADKAVERNLYTVTDKPAPAPSGDIHDYWSLAPYWWPNPENKGGLPYIRRDGEWSPEAKVDSKTSSKYDRSRIYNLFIDSTILALAWKFTGDEKYASHVIEMLKVFFLDRTTRMNPNLNFAQVRLGNDNDKGAPYGIIEGEGMFYYLDSIKILNESGLVDTKTLSEFKHWLKSYLKWMLNSEQGKLECQTRNNHGTLYDLQVASIAEFINDKRSLFSALSRAESRIGAHFAKDGSQPEELARTNTAHYCCSNYQAWVYLTMIAAKWGKDMWTYKPNNGGSLTSGARWLLNLSTRDWPYQQINVFDKDRFAVIYWTIPPHIATRKLENFYSRSPYSNDIMFGPGYSKDPNPNNSVQPYWNLGLRSVTILHEHAQD